MNFFCDSNGEIFFVTGENVYQGGKKANTFYFIAAFPKGLMVGVTYQLPNGVTKYELPCTGLDLPSDKMQTPSGQPYNVWKIDVPDIVTQYPGTVSVQFFIHATDESVIPTSLSSFEVLRGVPSTEAPDIDYTEEYTNWIEGEFSKYGTDISSVEERVSQVEDKTSNIASNNVENTFTETQNFKSAIRAYENIQFYKNVEDTTPTLVYTAECIRNIPNDQYYYFPEMGGTFATQSWVEKKFEDYNVTDDFEDLNTALDGIIEIQNALMEGNVGNIIYELTDTDKDEIAGEVLSQIPTNDIVNDVLAQLPTYDGAVEVEDGGENV